MSCQLVNTHQSFGGTHCYCLHGRIMVMETAGYSEALVLFSNTAKTKFREKLRLKIPRNVRNPTFYCGLHRRPQRMRLCATFRHHHHHHHHHISVMELGHLLTRSGLTYPEVSSKVCHNSFCQLENSVSLPWVIYYEAFYLHVVSSFSCTAVICPKLVLFLIPL